MRINIKENSIFKLFIIRIVYNNKTHFSRVNTKVFINYYETMEL